MRRRQKELRRMTEKESEVEVDIAMAVTSCRQMCLTPLPSFHSVALMGFLPSLSTLHLLPQGTSKCMYVCVSRSLSLWL